MIRVGIVGTDNSHARYFSEMMNREDYVFHVPGFRAVAICGDDPILTKQIAETYEIEHICESPQHMLRTVDAAMIEYRHGSRHAEAAKLFLKNRIPLFIDKPLTSDTKEAEEILDMANLYNTLLTSYSTLRFEESNQAFYETLKAKGDVKYLILTSPADKNSEYDGIFFYAVHPVEVMNQVLGCGASSVLALEQDSNIVALIRHRVGATVCINLLGYPGAKGMSVSAFCANDWATKHDLFVWPACFRDGFAVFARMLQTGKAPLGFEEMLEPVKVLAAINESLRAGREIGI